MEIVLLIININYSTVFIRSTTDCTTFNSNKSTVLHKIYDFWWCGVFPKKWKYSIIPWFHGNYNGSLFQYAKLLFCWPWCTLPPSATNLVHHVAIVAACWKFLEKGLLICKGNSYAFSNAELVNEIHHHHLYEYMSTWSSLYFSFQLWVGI